MSFEVRPFNSASVAPPASLADFHWPLSFQEGAPLDLEIGCGVGWHPIRYATENPNRRLIAIEHTREKFERFQSRVERHPELSNLLPIHADAIRWVTHALQPAQPTSIAKCFLLYPNPEPKAPNKRWFRMPFMGRLIEALVPNGEILLATNEEWYCQEALDWAANAWNLEIAASRSFTQASHPKPRTHFEKKYLLRGETCYELVARKKP